MKKLAGILLALIAVSALLILGACATGMTAKEAGCPVPTGQAVMDYLSVQNPYQKWEMWPGKGELYKGQHPHGSYLTTYLSPLAFYSVKEKGGVIPNTAFIVKENYTPEKKLAAVTVMYKVEGYNPEGGNWFWLKYTPDGKIAAEGKAPGCIGCHEAVKGNDWLFTGPAK